MIKRTRLRKVGKVLHTSIPADLINVLGLLDGDEVAWEITGGSATLKFLIDRWNADHRLRRSVRRPSKRPNKKRAAAERQRP